MIAKFLSSVYTLLLMSCVAIVVYVLCKINEHWNPDELYLVIAIRGNMSYRRLKQVHFFLLGMAFSGFVYSIIYLILNMLFIFKNGIMNNSLAVRFPKDSSF